MQTFEYIPAATVDEAINILAREGAQARVLCGGTDLLVQLREGRRKLHTVIDIKHIPEVNELSYDPATGLHIGAAVPCYRIYGHPAIAAAYPGIIDAATLIGGIQVQGRASLGGNLCNASPAADSIPSLIVHGAVAVIAGGADHHVREVPVEAFCTSPGRTVLQTGEILLSLHLPPPIPNCGGAYLRFIPRNEMDIAVVGVGAWITLDESRTTVTAARIALGAVAPTPLFVPEAGAILIGKTASPQIIAEAATIAQAAARPISDMRGSAQQRRHLVGVLTGRALHIALKRAQQ